MHAVADTLRGYGFDVRFPKCSEGRRLTIVNAKDARSEVTVQDSGFITWDYWPRTGSETDPADIAGLILGILGPSMAHERPTINHALTLKGAVGHALRKLGLNVALVVYEDDETLNVTGEIVVTNPAYPCSGSVRVTDDGCMVWECQTNDTADQCALTVADTVVPVIANGIETWRERLPS